MNPSRLETLFNLINKIDRIDTSLESRCHRLFGFMSHSLLNGHTAHILKQNTEYQRYLEKCTNVDVDDSYKVYIKREDELGGLIGNGCKRRKHSFLIPWIIKNIDEKVSSSSSSSFFPSMFSVFL